MPLLLLFSVEGYAQQKKEITLKEVLHLAYNKSNSSKVLDSKVKSAELAYESSKNSQLPESKITGTYMLMNSPTVDLKIPLGNGGSAPAISSNQLMIGQFSVNMPLYTGGKIKAGIQAAEDNWKATALQASANKEQIAIQALHLYITLYKAQQTTALVAENIRKSEQRVKDFQAMESNGIIARNDLLKAQLQLSNYKVSYQEALKNVEVLTYQLNTLLGFPENNQYAAISLATEAETALPANPASRLEMQALEAQKELANDQINLTKSAYYPTVFASAGYAALQVQHVVSVYNAANVGLGISYDIGSLYKNKKKVHEAQQHLEEINLTAIQMEDKIKNEIHQAQQEMRFAQEKQQLFAEALEQAHENYRIVKNKYDNGVADTDELLEADVQELQSEINLAIGKATIVEKYYDLLLANGQLNLK